MITVRFDGNSSDIAKKEPSTVNTSVFNHDGRAFVGYVRSTPSEAYDDNVVDYAQTSRDVAEYRKNIKSGKWREFRNGE